MSKLRFGKFGLVDNPIGGHCTYKHGDGLLIGEVIGVTRSEHRGFTFLKVKHFDGTPWPFDPIAANVEMLDREYENR